MPVAEITAAISSVKTATTIVKGLINLSKDVAVKQKAAELLGVILSLQNGLSSLRSDYDQLLESKRGVEKQLKEFYNWSETESRYKLEEVHTSIFVYSPKESKKRKQPIHWLCTNCWEDRKKSILQCDYKHSKGASYTCPRCKTPIKMRFESSDNHRSPIVRTRNRWMDF
jgi:hypothetical protein